MEYNWRRPHQRLSISLCLGWAATTTTPHIILVWIRVDVYASSLLTLCVGHVEVVCQKNTFEILWLRVSYKTLVNYLNINLYVLLILFSHPMHMLSSWRYKVLSLVLRGRQESTDLTHNIIAIKALKKKCECYVCVYVWVCNWNLWNGGYIAFVPNIFVAINSVSNLWFNN